MKHCNGCGEGKELSEFNFRKSGRYAGKPFSRCKKCEVDRVKKWGENNPEKVDMWYKRHSDENRKRVREYNYKHGAKPASENKSCSAYLGCVIAETVLMREFPGFKRMPNCNPDYDYECPQGFLIDVKSSTKRSRPIGNSRWVFSVRNNKRVHYFIFIAFDDLESLTPMHIWLIPGYLVNDRTGISIPDTIKSLAKWSKYERSLKNVLECCDKMRKSD